MNACPHCGADRIPAHHLRDHGTADPDEAIAAGYCPYLVRRRDSLHHDDARTAAREDVALATMLADENDLAEAMRSAARGESPWWADYSVKPSASLPRRG